MKKEIEAECLFNRYRAYAVEDLDVLRQQCTQQLEQAEETGKIIDEMRQDGVLKTRAQRAELERLGAESELWVLRVQLIDAILNYHAQHGTAPPEYKVWKQSSHAPHASHIQVNHDNFRELMNLLCVVLDEVERGDLQVHSGATDLFHVMEKRTRYKASSLQEIMRRELGPHWPGKGSGRTFNLYDWLSLRDRWREQQQKYYDVLKVLCRVVESVEPTAYETATELLEAFSGRLGEYPYLPKLLNRELSRTQRKRLLGKDFSLRNWSQFCRDSVNQR